MGKFINTEPHQENPNSTQSSIDKIKARKENQGHTVRCSKCLKREYVHIFMTVCKHILCLECAVELLDVSWGSVVDYLESECPVCRANIKWITLEFHNIK